MILRRREQLAGAALETESNKALHRVVVLLQRAAVAVRLVNGPGTNNAGIRPRGTAVIAGHHTWGNTRELAVGSLTIVQIDKPLGEERLDVGVQGGSADIDLGVASPTHAFVALRAIGGDVDEIGALGPVDVVVELVEHRVGAGEGSHYGGVAAQRDADDRVLGRFAAQPRDLDVLETVEGETRLPGLSAFAFADVSIRGAGAAQVDGVNGAVRIEALSKPERDLLARLTGHLETRDANEVLPQVEHENARLSTATSAGGEFLDGADRRTGMRLHERMHFVDRKSTRLNS